MIRRGSAVAIAFGLAVGIGLAPVAAPVVWAAAEAVDDEYGLEGSPVLEDRPFVVDAPGVLANDGASGGRVACVVRPPTTSARGGTVQMAPNGGFTYLPPTNFFGRDSIAYRIAGRGSGPECPDAAEASAVVRLQVTPINDAPWVALRAGCPPGIVVPEDSGPWGGSGICAQLASTGPANE